MFEDSQAVQEPARPYQERHFIQSLLVEDKPPEGSVSEVLLSIQQAPVKPLLPATDLLQLLQERYSLAGERHALKISSRKNHTLCQAFNEYTWTIFMGWLLLQLLCFYIFNMPYMQGSFRKRDVSSQGLLDLL